MATIDSIFELAIELRNNGELRHAINLLSKLLIEHQIDEKTAVVYTVLGGIHADLAENDKALINFKKATELNSKSEFASLGLYVTYAELQRDEEAIHEMIRYLKSYPAGSYKATLEELLEGQEEGYMTNYEEDIRHFARINGVETWL